MKKLLYFLAFTLLIAPLHAEEIEPAGPPVPAIPETDKDWDWIKLDTGELLKGEILAMYEEDLDFDSDHFGKITIDWGDVVEVISSDNQAIRTESKQILTGKMVMKDEEVTVTLGQAQRTIPKEEVVSIATGREREIHKWSAKVSTGATFRGGNTEQTTFNTKASAQRRTATTRFFWDWSGNFSDTNGVTTEDNHRSNAYFDYYFSKRFFVRPANLEYYSDPFSNIQNRFTLSASLGYTVVDIKDFSIDITGGPSWQTVEFVEVLEGEPRTEDSLGGLVTTVVDWDITKRIEFIGTYRAQWAPEESGGISGHVDNTFELEITNNLDLDVSFVWDYLQYPTPDSEGKTPDNNDYWLIFALGWDL